MFLLHARERERVEEAEIGQRKKGIERYEHERKNGAEGEKDLADGGGRRKGGRVRQLEFISPEVTETFVFRSGPFDLLRHEY